MPVNLVCKDLSLDHVPPIEAILAEIVDDIFLPWHAAAAVLLSLDPPPRGVDAAVAAG